MKLIAMTLSLLLLAGASYAQSPEATTTTSVTTETPAGEVKTDVTTTTIVPQVAPQPPEPPKPTAYDAITREPIADPNARRDKEPSLRDQVRGKISDEARGGR